MNDATKVTLGIRSWIALAALAMTPALAFGIPLYRWGWRLDRQVHANSLAVQKLIEVQDRMSQSLEVLVRVDERVRSIERRLERIEDKSGAHLQAPRFGRFPERRWTRVVFGETGLPGSRCHDVRDWEGSEGVRNVCYRL